MAPGADLIQIGQSGNAAQMGDAPAWTTVARI
jgi:hypothetical protein